MQKEVETNSPIIVMLQRNGNVAMRKNVTGMQAGPLMFQSQFEAVTK